MRLGEGDLRALLACAGELAAIDEPDALPGQVALFVRNLIPSDFVAYNEMDLHTPRSRVVTDPGELAEHPLNAVWERLMPQHPVVAHAQRTGDLSAHSISDFLGRRGRTRLELFAEVFRPLGVVDQLGTFVQVGEQAAIGVAASRSGRDFDDRERAVLEALRPHLVLAYRRAEARAQVRSLMERLTTFDELDRGLIELGRDGRVAHATSGAARLLPRYFATAREAIEPGRIERGDGVLVIQRLGEGWLLLEEWRDPFARARLTPREREVLVRATRGETDREIAAALGVSPRTVAKHLERSYAKLDVRGRREAARLLRQVAPRGDRAPGSEHLR